MNDQQVVAIGLMATAAVIIAITLGMVSFEKDKTEKDNQFRIECIKNGQEIILTGKWNDKMECRRPKTG